MVWPFEEFAGYLIFNAGITGVEINWENVTKILGEEKTKQLKKEISKNKKIINKGEKKKC